MTQPLTQSQFISFELHSLGWKAFQDLCSTIVSEVLGQTVQSFLPTHDGGRDGAFHGVWAPTENQRYEGSFTVQCKFSSNKEHSLTLSGVSDELKKAAGLAERGLSKHYILMTNCKLSGTSEEKIRKAFLSIDQIEYCFIFGYDWVNQKIRESSRLRILVPRVYGLGDLSQILDERAFAQAQEILSFLGDDLAKFVITEAYRKSAKALVTQGFVLLLGEPASGKSTIAASLAVGAIDLWKCSTINIRNADEFILHWNPYEPKRFFWVDDAFGATQYDETTAKDWNQVFPHMAAAIKRGAPILFTSRDYVYEAALRNLKLSAFPLLKDSKVIINVQDLTEEEKDQILYNHVKLGNQINSFKKRIKRHLPNISRNRRFLPEIARRLGDRLFTRSLSIDTEGIKKFVEEPVDFLIEIVQTLDRESKAAIALVYLGGSSIDSPISLSAKDKKAIELLGATPSGVREAMVSMNGSLVKLIKIEGGSRWKYKHPTVGDAFAKLVSRDAELLDIYLEGAQTEKLLQEITCGNVELQGAEIIVPPTRYEMIIEKIDLLDEISMRNYFLSSRCDKKFLARYIEKHGNIFKALIPPGSYLHASSGVLVLSRLHELGLLPDEWRERFVGFAGNLAVLTPDADFLELPKIRSLFNEDEIKGILERVRSELLPKLSREIEYWRDNYDGQTDPDEYFSLLGEALTTFRNELSFDAEAVSRIDDALNEIDSCAEDLRSEYYVQEPDYEHYDRASDDPRPSSDERDIFDDVDA